MTSGRLPKQHRVRYGRDDEVHLLYAEGAQRGQRHFRFRLFTGSRLVFFLSRAGTFGLRPNFGFNADIFRREGIARYPTACCPRTRHADACGQRGGLTTSAYTPLLLLHLMPPCWFQRCDEITPYATRRRAAPPSHASPGCRAPSYGAFDCLARRDSQACICRTTCFRAVPPICVFLLMAPSRVRKASASWEK